MIKKYIVCIFILITLPAYAWNAAGHHIIAQIAYDNLNEQTLRLVRKYNSVVNKSQLYKDNIITASSWLDRLSGRDLANVKYMHYINLSQPQKYNAVWAVQMACDYMHRDDISLLKKGIALRILLHVVGDLHQPLHTTSYGDRGGNLFMLKRNNVARNLHSYWDNGGGIWVTRGGFPAKKIKLIAKQLEKEYPCKSTTDLDPMHWAQESNKLGVNVAYNELPKDRKPDATYQKHAQEISKYRVAQAGCRLAKLIQKTM